MKRVTFTVATLLLLTLTVSGISTVRAQDTTSAPTNDKRIPVDPNMKGVGTAKVVKGTKNALRKTEGFAGTSARKVGKEASKDTGKVKKSLSQDVRKVQNALGGHKKKSTSATTPSH